MTQGSVGSPDPVRCRLIVRLVRHSFYFCIASREPSRVPSRAERRVEPNRAECRVEPGAEPSRAE